MKTIYMDHVSTTAMSKDAVKYGIFVCTYKENG